jgi:hypothetical protein
LFKSSQIPSKSNFKVDVFDGEAWKKSPHLQQGGLAIGLFVDGLSPFRSSKVSFWIMYAFILNLPEKER